jgi:peptidoglycan/LPS O-acetylase OafA/YrhL
MHNPVDIARAARSEGYRPDIDGLRAIAVGSVVLCHAFPHLLPGGFVGVDIFFVISGYLISSILIGEFERDSFSIANFYVRRIKRIFPALLSMMLAVMLFGWIFLFKSEFAALGRHVAASTLYSENFLLWSEASYFDVSSELKPLLHLWSLAIEEQFYIFWPLLMYFAHRGKINFVLMFGALAGISFALNLHDVANAPTAAYYSPLGRAWELMIGSCLAYVRVHRPELLSGNGNGRSIAGLLLLVLALGLVGPTRGFPGFWALLPTLGSALLIAGGADSWINRRLLAARPMVWCGLISYPLYLWHWPLLSFFHIIYGRLSTGQAVACVLSATILATLTFRYIERPFRHRGNDARKVGLLGATMAGAMSCGIVIMSGAIVSRLHYFNEPTLTEWDFLKARTPDFDDSNSTGVFHLGPGRANNVLFIGDSHIAQYASRIDRIIMADPQKPGAVLAIGGGCIPIEGVDDDDPHRRSCWKLRDEAYAMAAQPQFRTIVIGGAWNWYFLGADYVYEAAGKKTPLSSAQGRQAALQRLGERIAALTRSGDRVVLMLDNPLSQDLKLSGVDIRLSLSQRRLDADRTVKVDARQLELRQQLLDLAKRSGADVIDPFGAVCVENVCRVTDDTGLPMYKDEGHFNPDWAIGHASFIDTALNR